MTKAALRSRQEHGVGAEKGTVEGKDFADALFSVWLGANPYRRI